MSGISVDISVNGFIYSVIMFVRIIALLVEVVPRKFTCILVVVVADVIIFFNVKVTLVALNQQPFVRCLYEHV
jgi:hypothetical protein